MKMLMPRVATLTGLTAKPVRVALQKSNKKGPLEYVSLSL